MTLTLHGYWRSGAAWRVRIALALKGLDVVHVAHDLREGAQRTPAYRALAPQGLVPALATDAGVITQSLAIIEWLEDTHPEPPLLPAAPIARARVRAMAALIACDIHPLHNLRVLDSLRRDLGADEARVQGWIARWITAGLAALETMVAPDAAFLSGEAPGLADCCLIPQMFVARRFDVDLTPFPRLRAVAARCEERPAFRAAHAAAQTDADPPDADPPGAGDTR